jgi:hypothetical protein
VTYPTILGAEALGLEVPGLEKQAPICIQEKRNADLIPFAIASKTGASRTHDSTLGTGVGNERWMERRGSMARGGERGGVVEEWRSRAFVWW